MTWKITHPTLGMFVVVSDEIPWEEKQVGHNIYWAHPLVRWLSRWLPIKPYVSTPMIKRWRDAFRLNDRLIVPPEMLPALRALEAQEEG